MASPLILYKTIEQNWVDYPHHIVMLERQLGYRDKYTDIAFKLSNLLTNIINTYVRSTLGVMLKKTTETASTPGWMLQFVQHIYPSSDKSDLGRRLYGITHVIPILQSVIDQHLSRHLPMQNESFDDIESETSQKVENKLLQDIYVVLIESYVAKKALLLDQILTDYMKKYSLGKNPVVLYRIYLYNKPIKDFFTM